MIVYLMSFISMQIKKIDKNGKKRIKRLSQKFFLKIYWGWDKYSLKHDTPNFLNTSYILTPPQQAI